MHRTLAGFKLLSSSTTEETIPSYLHDFVFACVNQFERRHYSVELMGKVLSGLKSRRCYNGSFKWNSQYIFKFWKTRVKRGVVF